jgi:capsular polysaccharide transport system ATP-binding protein
MSIELRDVSVRTRNTITPIVLQNLNIRIGNGDHAALLAPPNSGLDLVINVICGANAPETGRVIRAGSLSWPIPTNSFIQKHLSFIANARFIANLYEVDQRSFIAKVIEMAGIADVAEERISYVPGKASSRFGFALGACLHFDTYLLTSTSFGEKEERDKYADIIAELGQRSGLLIATSNGKHAQAFCDKAFVLERDGAAYYDDIEAALEHLERISKRVVDAGDGDLAEEDERVFDDFQF